MTRAELIAEITAVIYENTTGAITPTTLAALIDVIVDHVVLLDEAAAVIEMGSINCNDDTHGYMVNGVKLVGAQEADVADLDDVVVSAPFSNTEVQGLLNNIIDDLGRIKAVLRNHGLMATGAP
jgi:hypothetical protein